MERRDKSLLRPVFGLSPTSANLLALLANLRRETPARTVERLIRAEAKRVVGDWRAGRDSAGRAG